MGGIANYSLVIIHCNLKTWALCLPPRKKREIVDHREKSTYIVNQSCFASCYFSKESCIIVLHRVKNKKSFFPMNPDA